MNTIQEDFKMLQTVTVEKENDKLDELSKLLNRKADLIKDNKRKLDAIKLALADLRMQEARLKQDNDQLNQNITDELDKQNCKKFETDKYSFAPRNYAPSLIIDNQDLIPNMYQKQVIKTTTDKTAIKNDLKRGNVIGGVHLKPTRKTKITER